MLRFTDTRPNVMDNDQFRAFMLDLIDLKVALEPNPDSALRRGDEDVDNRRWLDQLMLRNYIAGEIHALNMRKLHAAVDYRDAIARARHALSFIEDICTVSDADGATDGREILETFKADLTKILAFGKRMDPNVSTLFRLALVEGELRLVSDVARDADDAQASRVFN